MNVVAVKTGLVESAQTTIEAILDEHLKDLPENSVLAITSKIIALCEDRTVDAESVSRDELIAQEADWVLPPKFKNKYIPLTIKDNTLIPAAGIDKSNSAGRYVLWPKNSQDSAAQIRSYLKKRFGLKNVGVIITDSGAMPLRFGTMGIVIGYSGFNPFRNYKGQKDLFDEPLMAGKANLAGGLAAAAVTVMGEGTEQTPLAVISNIPGIEFSDHEPKPEELADYFLAPEAERMFAPFIEGIDWQPGPKKKS